jgi:hypothetical protein
MNEQVRSRAWWSQAVLVGAVIAVVLLPLGAVGSRFGVWGFQTGFLFLAAGTVLATLGAVVGLIGIIVAFQRQMAADKPALLIGTLVSVLILAVMGMQFNAARSVPPIHNISTDVTDPPTFVAIVALRGEGANPLAYDSATLAEQQQAAYPWLKTLETANAPSASFDKALAALEGMGLEIVNADRGAGILEATATTFWFGFKDDLVVRIRPAGSGSIVDVRSVSRVGQSDLGVNARRIGKFFEAFEAG